MLGSVLHGIAPASTWALELVRECNSPAVVHEIRQGVQFPQVLSLNAESWGLIPQHWHRKPHPDPLSASFRNKARIPAMKLTGRLTRQVADTIGENSRFPERRIAVCAFESRMILRIEFGLVYTNRAHSCPRRI